MVKLLSPTNVEWISQSRGKVLGMDQAERRHLFALMQERDRQRNTYQVTLNPPTKMTSGRHHGQDPPNSTVGVTPSEVGTPRQPRPCTGKDRGIQMRGKDPPVVQETDTEATGIRHSRMQEAPDSHVLGRSQGAPTLMRMRDKIRGRVEGEWQRADPNHLSWSTRHAIKGLETQHDRASGGRGDYILAKLRRIIEPTTPNGVPGRWQSEGKPTSMCMDDVIGGEKEGDGLQAYTNYLSWSTQHSTRGVGVQQDTAADRWGNHAVAMSKGVDEPTTTKGVPGPGRSEMEPTPFCMNDMTRVQEDRDGLQAAESKYLSWSTRHSIWGLDSRGTTDSAPLVPCSNPWGSTQGIKDDVHIEEVGDRDSTTASDFLQALFARKQERDHGGISIRSRQGRESRLALQMRARGNGQGLEPTHQILQRVQQGQMANRASEGNDLQEGTQHLPSRDGELKLRGNYKEGTPNNQHLVAVVTDDEDGDTTNVVDEAPTPRHHLQLRQILIRRQRKYISQVKRKGNYVINLELQRGNSQGRSEGSEADAGRGDYQRPDCRHTYQAPVPWKFVVELLCHLRKKGVGVGAWVS